MFLVVATPVNVLIHRVSLYCLSQLGGTTMKYWKRLYGINLWKLNRTLNKLAHSKELLQQQSQNGVVTVRLKPDNSHFQLGLEQKKEIEQTIFDLDGFQLLQLVLFQKCVPVYKETRRVHDIERTIEIHIKS